MIERTSGAQIRVDMAHLGRVRERVEADIAASRYDGARILAAHRGEIILDLTAGYADRQNDAPLRPDAIFSVMSLTKIMTATSIMRLVERGQLALTTPVAEVIPEFARHGKANITIWQLLSHTAGFGSAPIPIAAERIGDLRAAAMACCNITPETVPGEQVSYSGQAAFAVLGEVAVRLDELKRPLRQILAEDIFIPLDMRDTAMGAPERFRARRVPVVVRAKHAPELNAAALAARDNAATEATEMPFAGVYSTGPDMLRFAEALRRGGALDGATILSPASLALMTKNQTGDKPNSLMMSARVTRGFPSVPAYLGLGLFLRGEGVFPTLFGTLASPSTFGGFGLGSTTLWVDPLRDLTFVALTAGLMERIESQLRFQTLADVVFGALRA